MIISINCGYCNNIFEYNKKARGNRKYCDTCVKLRRELYPYAFISNKTIKEVLDPGVNMKKVFSWDEGSVLI